MATGETTFSTQGRQVVKFESKPLPTNVDYDFKLNDDWEIRTAEGVGKLPYLNGSLEMLNTASKEGGKNRKTFHKFFLDLSPGSDGVSMVDRGHGLVAFCRSTGDDLNVGVVTKPKGEEQKMVQCLAPKATLAWLKAHAGCTGKLRLKVETDRNGVPRNVVDYFIEGEAGAPEAAPEEEAEVAPEEAEETGLEASESDEEEEVATPPAPPSKKPAPKPVQMASKAKKK